MVNKVQQDISLWIHDNGQVCCPEHFGRYAASELDRAPHAQLLHTPLGTWERLTRADLAQLVEMTGKEQICEICEAQIRSRQHIKLVK